MDCQICSCTWKIKDLKKKIYIYIDFWRTIKISGRFQRQIIWYRPSTRRWGTVFFEVRQRIPWYSRLSEIVIFGVDIPANLKALLLRYLCTKLYGAWWEIFLPKYYFVYNNCAHNFFSDFVDFLALPWSNLSSTESQRISDKKGGYRMDTRKGSGRKSGQAWINTLSDLDSRTFAILLSLFFLGVVFLSKRFCSAEKMTPKRQTRTDKW